MRRGYAEADPLTDLAAHIAPDAEFDFSAAYPDRPVLRGVDDLRTFRAQGPWATLEFEPEKYFDVDDERVLVFVRVRATGATSGAPVEVRNAHEFTIREGKITRIKIHRDRGEALLAVGLRE